VRFLLRDAWNNVETLSHYAGPVEIFGATSDNVIPIAHAQSLAKQIRGAHFTAISGGHNDWSGNEEVKIRRRIEPKVLLPCKGGGGAGNDTLCQNQLLPWLEWTKP